MCMNPARLATVLAAVLLLANPVPAQAALFGGNRARAQEAAAQEAAEAAGPRRASAEERRAAERLDPLARVAFWSREVQVDPTEAEAGVRLAAALRALGRYDEASIMAQQVLVTHPDHVDALLEDARAKIAAGQPFYAIDSLTRARRAAPQDWRPVSLLGVAYEQTQRPEEAREAFIAALQLSPEEPAVLTNFALFYAARGDRDQAETLLRRAVANPASGARERQNLALVLGLQGKLAEAERLMRQDLPPEIADANLAYLRGEATEAAPSARTWGAALGGPGTP